MTHTVLMDWDRRLSGLRAAVADQRLDGFVVSTPLNVTYLTGFSGSSSLLVVTPAKSLLIVDGRYEFAVREAVGRGEVGPITLERFDKRYDVTLAAVIARERLVRIGFEAGQVTVATLASWQKGSASVEWVSTEKVVERQRAIKDDREIAIFRRGGRAIARVAADLPHIVRRDRTEKEVADAIDAALRTAGFSRPAFPTIVASGPNSALPHARPTDRRLAPGDLVVLDFGGVLDGYCLDLTRMAAVTPVS